MPVVSPASQPTIAVAAEPTLPLPVPPHHPPLAAMPPLDRLLRLALLLELVLAVTTTLESLVVAVVGFGAFVPVLLTAGLAVVLAGAARDAGRGRVRRTTRWLQWAFLASAVVDVVVAALLSSAPPPLLPVTSRVLLPVTVLLLARRARRTATTDTVDTVADADGIVGADPGVAP